MKYDDLLPLIPYVTPNQALLIQALSDTGSHRKAAKKLGIDHRNIHRTIVPDRCDAVIFQTTNDDPDPHGDNET